MSARSFQIQNIVWNVADSSLSLEDQEDILEQLPTIEDAVIDIEDDDDVRMKIEEYLEDKYVFHPVNFSPIEL